MCRNDDLFLSKVRVLEHYALLSCGCGGVATSICKRNDHFLLFNVKVKTIKINVTNQFLQAYLTVFGLPPSLVSLIQELSSY